MSNIPQPREAETDNEYRRRLRTWYDSVGDGSDSSWAYICSLMGVSAS